MVIYIPTTQEGRMTPEALMNFLKEEQKDDVAIEECKEIVKNFESSNDKSSFSKEGFSHFMMFNDWQVLMNIYHKVLTITRRSFSHL